MPAMEPIYQYYVDAIRGRAEANLAQEDLKINQLKAGMELTQLQQQIQEQQLARQVFGNQQTNKSQPGAFDPAAAGGATPGANPTTGQDPSLQTADLFDAMGKGMAQFNQQKSAEWFTKASTLRDQYYTRMKAQIEIQNQQAGEVGKLFGSVEDQDSYTNALIKLQDQGINITAFGLSGNFAADHEKLKSIAQSTMTYKDKLNAQHQQATEQQAMLNYNEHVRHDMADEGLSRAKVGIEGEAVGLRAEWQKADLDFKSRADARAQAGLSRTDAMDLEKTRDFVRRPGKNDKQYVDSVIADDPKLKDLSPQAKQMASAEIQIRARAALARKVQKPGDTPSSDEFLGAVADAVKEVSKRATAGSSGFLGYGSKPATLHSLPASINSRAEFNQLPVGGQFTKGGKIYKKTGNSDFEEIK